MFKAIFQTALLIALLAPSSFADEIPTAASPWFPVGDLFEPVLADPKQEHSYVSAHSYDVEGVGTYTVGAVGYGADFGVYRWSGASLLNGTQLSVKGGVFSQFNLDSHSMDLLNTDYTIGFVLTHRHGPLSMRAKFYHQSTHLGDEFLLSDAYPNDQRVNYSYEAFDLLLSLDIPLIEADARSYIGWQYRVHRTPHEFRPGSAQGGLELYVLDNFCSMNWDLCRGRFVSGLDMQFLAETHWNPNTSVKAGIEWGRPGSGHRRVRALFEAYKGHMPYGQFYRSDISSYGCGIYLYY